MFTLDQAGRRRHEVEVRPPPPTLRPWVEHVVVDRRPAGERGRWRIVPDPSGHIVVTFGGGAPACRASPSAPGSTDAGLLGPLLRTTVVGARTRWIDVDVTPRGTTIGVRFRPGGLAALLREPAGALTDRGVDLVAALGRVGGEGLERVGRARTIPEAVAALTGMLSAVAARGTEPDWRARAVDRVLAADGGRGGPAALADATGMAPRTLRAVAAGEVGISPGRWVRVHRLFRALEMSAARPAPSWSWIAARAGYHDPPHLTREFRALLGETPTAWSRRRAS